MEPNPECVLKPGEECAFCRYVRPSKKAPKPRIECARCVQPFVKGERRRLYRGKWVHVDKTQCVAL